MNKGAPRREILPVAGEDLLCHLDGDVTLLPPLVQIQQVSSQARGWLKNGVCSALRWMMRKEGERDEEKGCETHNMGICVCEVAIIKPLN